MSFFSPDKCRWVRRAAVRGVVAAVASMACGAVLGGCGGGSVAHPEAPQRVIVQVTPAEGWCPWSQPHAGPGVLARR